jgi:hypothetical protein
MSPEEFEDIQAYVEDIGPLVEEQSRLNALLDPDLSFNFLDVTSADIEAYKEAIESQNAVWEELSNIQPPARMAESHQLRILAASQLYQAASTMIVEIEGGKYFSENSPLMAAGRSQFETGLNTWNDAQFGLVLWDQLIEGSYIR